MNITIMLARNCVSKSRTERKTWSLSYAEPSFTRSGNATICRSYSYSSAFELMRVGYGALSNLMRSSTFAEGGYRYVWSYSKTSRGPGRNGMSVSFTQKKQLVESP